MDYLGIEDWRFFAAEPSDPHQRLLRQFRIEEEEYLRQEAHALSSALEREWQDRNEAEARSDSASREPFQLEDISNEGLFKSKLALRWHSVKMFLFTLRWKRDWRADFIHRAHVASEILVERPLKRRRTAVGALKQISQACHEVASTATMWPWLASCVVDGSGPSAESSDRLQLLHEFFGVPGIRRWLLEELREVAGNGDYPYSAIEVIRSGLLIDVTSTAQSDLLTGIQRVVVNYAKELADSDSAHIVHWNSSTRSFKRIENYWTGDGDFHHWGRIREVSGATLIPLECCFILPEVIGDVSRSDALVRFIRAGFASKSIAVAYDLIPIQYPGLVQPGSVESFARYLQALREFSLVVCISEHVEREFTSWFEIYYDHDRVHPTITTVRLPDASPDLGISGGSLDEAVAREEARRRSQKRVLIAGTFEPRKNQLRSLYACELLWQAGHEFEVVLVGFAGWPDYPVARVVELLVRKGRLVTIRSRVPDDDLRALQTTSDVVLFASLAEGFGLPVTEALSAGAIVVASRIPSIEEIATDDVILVDPLNVEDIAHGLTVALKRERREFPAVPKLSRSWREYVEEVLVASGISPGEVA